MIKKYLLLLFFSTVIMAKNIVLTSGQDEFEIVTSYNAGTGFSWYLKSFDKDLFSVVSIVSKSSSASLGSNVDLVWRFKINNQLLAISQVSNLQFVLIRPWESAVEKSLDVQIVIPGKIRSV
jgi:predicted secreted protein